MKAATHLALAGLTGVVASGFGAEPGVAGGAALAVGALLPDVDTTTSGLGKWAKPFSGMLEQRFGHRTVTHSLLGMAVVALVSSWLLVLWPPAWTWLLIGYATHLILDTANIIGVPLLWPMRLQFWMVHNRAWRVPYGSSREFGFLAGFALLSVALLPLSSDGFSPWFHRLVAAPYATVEDYLRWRDSYEVYAQIEGVNLLTNEDISGRYRIIDALTPEEFLVEDEMGRAYSVGQTQSANIQPTRTTAWRGQPLTTSTYRVDLAGRLVSDLIASLPAEAQAVKVNAELELSQPVPTPPVVGYFPRLKSTGTRLELRAATFGGLGALPNVVITEGSAVIRAEYAPGTQAQQMVSLVSSTPSYQSHVLNIPDLPSVVSGLVVSVGDYVEEGQLIARYVDDTTLEQDAEDLGAAQAKISDFEGEEAREREAHELRLTDLRGAVSEADEKLARVRYLVEREAEPRARLAEAEAVLKHAERAVLNEETAWTSTLARLESGMRDAGLSVSKLERGKAVTTEKQWVRSPVAGTISDIRVDAVTVKGVSLQVMILQGSGTQGKDAQAVPSPSLSNP